MNLSVFTRSLWIVPVLFLSYCLNPLILVHASSAEPETMVCGHTSGDVVLMLDRTGSISADNRVLIQEAAQNLISILLNANPNNRIALGRFGSMDCLPGTSGMGIDVANASLGEIFHDFSGDLVALENALATALQYSSCGATNLEDPIRDAEEILAGGTNQHKILVLLSDGNPNQPQGGLPPQTLALQAAEDLKSMNARIFTIAFDASSASDKTLRDFFAQIATHSSLDNTEGEVDDTEKQIENQDGDDFFIAPSGEDLLPVFSSIGEVILCEIEAKPESEEKSIPNSSPSYTLSDSDNNSNEALTLQGSGSMGCSLRKY